MIQTYAEAGYRVTVVCTLYKPPDGIELRPEVMQWTHDIHVLPIILRANDFPRYIKHLIESRGIKDVIFSNSMLIYEMLPALTEQMPHVKFIDVSRWCCSSTDSLSTDSHYRSIFIMRHTTAGSQAAIHNIRSSTSATLPEL